MKQLLDLLTLAKDVSGAQEVRFSVSDLHKGSLIFHTTWDNGKDVHMAQYEISAEQIIHCT